MALLPSRGQKGGPTVARARPSRVLLAVAAAVVAIAGAVTVAAGNAGPGSPLWPITTIVYGERADSRIAQQQAEETIRRAHEAIMDTLYVDAVRLLDEATVLVGQVRDPDVARQLTDQITALRSLIPAVGTTVPATAAPLPAPTPGTSAQPVPTPQPGSSSGSVLPPIPLPTLPLPTLPTLPTLPVPLPTLPVVGH